MIREDMPHVCPREEASHGVSQGEGTEAAGFSDAEEESWHSTFGSRNEGSYEDYHVHRVSDPEIGGPTETLSNPSDLGSSSDVDLEKGVHDLNPRVSKVERECRICHLSVESGNQESGPPIVLGCSCKNDLAIAHKHCAEAWFKIKGNKTCEICGSTAQNVVGATEGEFMDQWNETTSTTHGSPQETRSFWQGHKFLNFLLACMVFAFVISWLFHFNVPS